MNGKLPCFKSASLIFFLILNIELVTKLVTLITPCLMHKASADIAPKQTIVLLLSKVNKILVHICHYRYLIVAVILIYDHHPLLLHCIFSSKNFIIILEHSKSKLIFLLLLNFLLSNLYNRHLKAWTPIQRVAPGPQGIQQKP